jgi:hypothetical protein
LLVLGGELDPASLGRDLGGVGWLRSSPVGLAGAAVVMLTLVVL